MKSQLLIHTKNPINEVETKENSNERHFDKETYEKPKTNAVIYCHSPMLVFM